MIAVVACPRTEQAVKEWNDDARRDVKPATVKALTSLVWDAHQDALSTAARTVVAADEAGPDQNRRLDAAWSVQSDLDAALGRWGEAHQLLAWCNGHTWDKPWREMRPPEEIVARELAVRDEGLRRFFMDRDSRPQVATGQMTS